MVINTPLDAVKIAHDLINTGTYKLGTGDCDTPKGGDSDCAGFAINKCYNIRRHRPGFNKGSWATVEDDLNCNSAIEDAQHKQELFVVLGKPQVGSLLAYPTFMSQGKQFIGHVAIVTLVPDNYKSYKDLEVVQCCGPNGHHPGIIKTSASHWDDHDKMWPNHKTVILGVKG